MKYRTKFAVELSSYDRFLFRASELDGIKDFADPAVLQRVEKCHNYLLCKRPRVYTRPESFQSAETKFSIECFYRESGKEQSYTVELPSYTVPRGRAIEPSDYPHYGIVLKNERGQTKELMVLDDLVNRLPSCPATLKNYEVLYVGQAFGTDGSRSALDRLTNHATLQKIALDFQQDFADDTLFCLLVYFSPARLTLLTGTKKLGGVTGPKNKARIKRVLEKPISEGLQILIAEAALINRFQPTYNKVYKESFPKKGLKILDQFYELDIESIMLNLSTENIFISTFSPSQHVANEHFFEIRLKDDEKESFFDYLEFE